MKNNQTTQLEKIATNVPNKYVRVDVYYSKGGTNYFTGNSDPRGYWFSARVITDNGDGCYSFIITQGYRKFIKEAARFSASTLDAVADELRNQLRTENSQARSILLQTAVASNLQLAA